MPVAASDPQPPHTAPRAPKRRRWLRRVARWTLGLTLIAWLIGCSPITVYDFVTNIRPARAHPDLRVEHERPRLVVLAHGIWRTNWSMWRLERTLESQGYEVLNWGYPSTSAKIEVHAAALGNAIEKYLAKRRRKHPDAPEPQVEFVAHSMGGLVVRAYLQRANARTPTHCVFLSTPHRGATLARHYQDWSLYRWVMGNQAAQQLVPGDPIYQRLGPVRSPFVGCIYGGKADSEGYSKNIPGDDDRAVGVEEAQLPEQTDAIQILTSHTKIKFADEPIRQVLHFLRHHRFDHVTTSDPTEPRTGVDRR